MLPTLAVVVLHFLFNGFVFHCEFNLSSPYMKKAGVLNSGFLFLNFYFSVFFAHFLAPGFFAASWCNKSASPKGLSLAKSTRMGAATKMEE